MKVSLHASADQTIGWGHFFRVCALGEELVERGHRVLLALESDDRRLSVRAKSLGIEMVASSELSAGAAPSIAVIDDYRPRQVDLDGLQAMGTRLVQVVDAGVIARIPGALVVRPDPLDPSDGDLSGIEYAMICRDVLRQLEMGDVRVEGAVSVVVGGGGTGIEEEIAEGLRQSLDLEVIRPRLAMSRDLLDRSTYLHQIARSSVCVVGAGTTLWECAALGVPTVSIVAADNQRAQADWARRNGLSHTVEGKYIDSVVHGVVALVESPTLRRKMSRRCQQLVDGNGVRRIADWLEDQYGKNA